jgi:hypothetical protein
VALLSTVIVSVTGTIPVLGYVTPEVIESETCEQEMIEYIEIGEIDVTLPEDEKCFTMWTLIFSQKITK